MTTIPSELEILVTEKLETSGVLDNLRTQLQTHIQLLVAQYAKDIVAPSTRFKSPASGSINEHQISLEVILNFLQFFGLKNSVATLLAELKFIAPLSVLESLQLQASKTADETSKSITASLKLSTSGANESQPALTHIINKCSRMNTEFNLRMSQSDSLDESFDSTISSVNSNDIQAKLLKPPILTGRKQLGADLSRNFEEKDDLFQKQRIIAAPHPVSKQLPELQPLPNILSKPPLPPVVKPLETKKTLDLEIKPTASHGRRSSIKPIEESKETDDPLPSLRAPIATSNSKLDEEILLSDMDEIIEECVEYSEDDFEEESEPTSQLKYNDPIVPKGFEKRFDYIEDVKF
jgi:hypothetical protein